MTHLKWFTVCTLLILGSSNLFGDEQQNSRHFNINPNNMMGGMMNPMRNMFGGYDRNQGGYNNYYYDPYYPPQTYPGYPQGYGGYSYPSGNYGQPPMGYGAPATQYPTYPAYQQPTQQTSPTPSYSEQTTPHYQPAPEAGPNAQYRRPPQEQFKFRPMDQQPAQGSVQSNSAPYQQAPIYYDPQPSSGYYNSPTSSTYPQDLNYQPQPAVNQNPPQDSSTNYTPYNEASIPVKPTMKFRPLDQPGYSQ